MRLDNIVHLGIKELRSLVGDPMLLALIVYSFTASVYTVSKATPETLSNAAISVVDEDQSPLSTRIVSAFNPPYFLPPVMITRAEMDARLDAGRNHRHAGCDRGKCRAGLGDGCRFAAGARDPAADAAHDQRRARQRDQRTALGGGRQ